MHMWWRFGGGEASNMLILKTMATLNINGQQPQWSSLLGTKGLCVVSGDLGFSFEGCGSKQANWILGTNPRFSYGSWGRTQDIYVRFQNQAGIFIMDLEADQGPAGATTPT